jgi:hypothetical protein
MNKRIFLDVGAHTGETLAAVLDPGFRFDEIFVSSRRDCAGRNCAAPRAMMCGCAS